MKYLDWKIETFEQTGYRKGFLDGWFTGINTMFDLLVANGHSPEGAYNLCVNFLGLDLMDWQEHGEGNPPEMERQTLAVVKESPILDSDPVEGMVDPGMYKRALLRSMRRYAHHAEESGEEPKL